MARLKFKTSRAAEPAKADVAPEVTPEVAATTPKPDGWIDKETITTGTALREARELKEQLLAEFAEGRDVSDQIDSLDIELRQLEAKLQRLSEARKARAERGTQEAKAQRRERTRASLQQGLDEARKLGGLASDVLVRVVELGAYLSAIQESKDAVRANFHSALSGAALPEHVADSHYRLLGQVLNDLTMSDHLLRRVWSSGLGRTGVVVEDHFLSVKPLSGMYSSAGVEDPEAVIASAVAKLKAIAGDALKAQKGAA